jgi:hypothetical protein
VKKIAKTNPWIAIIAWKCDSHGEQVNIFQVKEVTLAAQWILEHIGP